MGITIITILLLLWLPSSQALFHNTSTQSKPSSHESRLKISFNETSSFRRAYVSDYSRLNKPIDYTPLLGHEEMAAATTTIRRVAKKVSKRIWSPPTKVNPPQQRNPSSTAQRVYESIVSNLLPMKNEGYSGIPSTNLDPTTLFRMKCFCEEYKLGILYPPERLVDWTLDVSLHHTRQLHVAADELQLRLWDDQVDYQRARIMETKRELANASSILSSHIANLSMIHGARASFERALASVELACNAARRDRWASAAHGMRYVKAKIGISCPGETSVPALSSEGEEDEDEEQ